MHNSRKRGFSVFEFAIDSTVRHATYWFWGGLLGCWLWLWTGQELGFWLGLAAAVIVWFGLALAQVLLITCGLLGFVSALIVGLGMSPQDRRAKAFSSCGF